MFQGRLCIMKLRYLFRYLVGHYRNHHGGLPPGMEDREQFICEQCSQVFLSENSLHSHISNKHVKGKI